MYACFGQSILNIVRIVIFNLLRSSHGLLFPNTNDGRINFKNQKPFPPLHLNYITNNPTVAGILLSLSLILLKPLITAIPYHLTRTTRCFICKLVFIESVVKSCAERGNDGYMYPLHVYVLR